MVLANSVIKGSYYQNYNFEYVFNLFCVDALLESLSSSFSFTCPEKKFTELCLTKRSRANHDCFIYFVKTLKKFLLEFNLRHNS